RSAATPRSRRSAIVAPYGNRVASDPVPQGPVDERPAPGGPGAPRLSSDQRFEIVCQEFERRGLALCRTVPEREPTLDEPPAYLLPATPLAEEGLLAAFFRQRQGAH